MNATTITVGDVKVTEFNETAATSSLRAHIDFESYGEEFTLAEMQGVGSRWIISLGVGDYTLVVRNQPESGRPYPNSPVQYWVYESSDGSNYVAVWDAAIEFITKEVHDDLMSN